MDNEAKVFDAEFYQKLNRFRMSLRMRQAAGMNGGRKSNSKGSSVEFSDFREYLPGDDIRRIDWSAYGRFDKLIVKLFMEEKEGLFHIMLDASGSMDFGEQKKSLMAQRIAGAFSYCILENADRLILNIMHGKDLTQYKGQTGRQALGRTLARLEDVNFTGETDLYGCIKRKEFYGKGITVLISDFYTDDLEDVLKYLTYAGQEVVCIQILSREEENPEFEGTVRLTDMETDDDIRATMTNHLMTDYRKSYMDFILRNRRVCTKYAAHYCLVQSDSSLEHVLFDQVGRIVT